MDRFPQMLFKAGGLEQFHGGSFSTLVVQDADALADALSAGWHETTPAAVEAQRAEQERAAQAAAAPATLEPDDTKPPTRAELEQKAVELGLDFDGRTTDRRLAEKIAAKLAAG